VSKLAQSWVMTDVRTLAFSVATH